MACLGKGYHKQAVWKKVLGEIISQPGRADNLNLRLGKLQYMIYLCAEFRYN